MYNDDTDWKYVNIKDREAVIGVRAVGRYQIFLLHDQQGNEWCDVMLFGKDHTASNGIKCHKMILASVSPHLRAAFKSEGFVDSGSSEYHIDQIEHATLQIIVDYIYTNMLRVVGEDIGKRMKSVLKAADYLLMPNLVNLCGQSLCNLYSYANGDNAINAWLFARKYHCKVLEEAALKACLSNKAVIGTFDKFLRMKASDVMSLLESLTKAKPPAAADLVCGAALDWLSFGKAERKHDGDEIMRQVPLKDMSAKALQHASKHAYLSAQVLWAVNQALAMRIEIDNLNSKKSGWYGERGTLTEDSFMRRSRYQRWDRILNPTHFERNLFDADLI